MKNSFFRTVSSFNVKRPEIKLLFLFPVFLFSTFSIIGQTAPCLPAANGEPAGNNAPGCLLCNFSYQGSTAGFNATVPGSSGFPCGTIENNSFISFIANGSPLNGNVTVTNCQVPNAPGGIQLILFDIYFNPVSNCFSAEPGIPGNISASGLTPGETYLIMTDGYAGDICDVEIFINSGIIISSPNAAVIDPDYTRDSLCLNHIASYSVQPVPGALSYDWEVSGNGRILGSSQGQDIRVKWEGTGSGYVRVVPNGCSPGPVSEVTVEIVDQFTSGPYYEYHCPEEFPFEINGTVIDDEGNYMITFNSTGGCDSIVEYEILKWANPTQLIEHTMCIGETFSFLGETYTDAGFYEIFVHKSNQVCDSLYELDLHVLANNVSIAPPPVIGCTSGATETLTANNPNSANQLEWTTNTGGTILSDPQLPSITIGSPGVYYLTSTKIGPFGSCVKTDSVTVTTMPSPDVPIFDTVSNFHCNLDTGLFVVNTNQNADSLLWIFENRDTFKTVFSDTLRYPWTEGGHFRVKTAAENECGIGQYSDTLITIKPIEAPGITLFSDSVCVGDTIILKTPKLDTAITLKWILNGGDLIPTSAVDSFGIVWNKGGQKVIQLSTVQDGCESPAIKDTLTIDEPFSNLIFNCQSTPSDISFSWNALPGADNYSVQVLTGQTGNLVDTTFSVLGLTPNEQVQIQVTVSGSNRCGNAVFNKTCVAQNCPPVSVNIDPISDICLSPSTSPQILIAQISGGTGGGILEWSGAGVIQPDLFNPTLAGVGSHQVELKYTEGICEYLSSQTVKVYQTPSSDFTATPAVCINENIQVRYTGNASQGAAYNWSFSGANIISNTSSGAYDLNFPDRGNYDLSLQVSENGCSSPVTVNTVQVNEPLATPVISCQSILDEIIFSWDDVPGASGFSTQVITGQSGTQVGNTFTVSGLSQGEEVTFSLTANGTNSCGSATSELTCEAVFCPPVSVFVDTIPQIVCEGEIFDFQLSVSNSGNLVFDSIKWMGSGISQIGIITYDTLSSGSYPISVEGYKGSCIYSDTFSFSVAGKPELSAQILAPIWNPGVVGGINLTVQNGSAPYDYLWSNGETSEDINLVARNQFCVTVTDNNGCRSTDCYVIGEGIYRVNPLHVVCRGDSKRISIRPGRGADFNWAPSTGLSCSDCPNPIVAPLKSTIYDVSARMPDGRIDTTKVFVIVVNPPFCGVLAQRDYPEKFLNESLEIDWKNVSHSNLQNIENQLKNLLGPSGQIPKKPLVVTPNPSTGLVEILNAGNLKIIEVFDFSGRKILETKSKQINLANQAKGVYFFKIKTGNEIFIKKIILI